MTEYRTGGGRMVTLGPQLGNPGGEGTIYRVSRRQVAKIWHEPTPPKARKVEIMLANPLVAQPASRGLLHRGGGNGPPCTWPQDALYDPNGRMVGYLMPAVDTDANRESQHFFNNVLRRRTEADFNVSFSDTDLLTMARNLADAVRQLHAAGYVIGDVNEKNVLIGAGCRVILVDMDAIQVDDPAADLRHRCTVGREDYTPPRLQGIRFAEVDREQNDDRFGLAVLVFKLVMGGMHPYTIRIDPDNEDAPSALGEMIRLGYFPYSEDARIPDEYKQKVPQYIEAWDNLRDELKHLFRVSFDPLYVGDRERPTAEDWVQALDTSIRVSRQTPARPRSRRNRSRRSNTPPSPAAPASPAGSPPAAGTHSARATGRVWQLLLAAGLVGGIAVVTSCIFVGGLAPVVGSALSPEPTPFPVVAAPAPTATPPPAPSPTPTAPPSPTDTPLPINTRPATAVPTALPIVAPVPTILPTPAELLLPTAAPLPTVVPTPAAPPPPPPTGTPLPPTPTVTPTPIYPNPLLMEQRGVPPSRLSNDRDAPQHVAGCFVGSEPRRQYWILLADAPSATVESANSPILLEFSKSIPREELRELIPGECYYVGPVFYQSDSPELRCPGTVYGTACHRSEMLSHSYRWYLTDQLLQEITEAPKIPIQR